MPEQRSNRWKPISDLPSNMLGLVESELKALQQVWVDQKHDLQASGAFDRSMARLKREWSIETGIIEGVYSLDRGITRTLVEHGIRADLISHAATDKSPELVARVIQDHQDTFEGILQFVKSERLLSTSYVKELHQALTRHQETYTVVDQHGRVFEKELEKGTYKTQPNNPIRPDGSMHEYCPPEHVASEMDQLILLHNQHGQQRVSPEVEAAWLHHSFTQIHPFQDGDGRVARALATLGLVKGGFFPLVITRDDRVDYISALEAADQGDLKQLITLFVSNQRRTMISVLSEPSGGALNGVDQIIASARELLEGRRRMVGDPDRTIAISSILNGLAKRRLGGLASELQAQLAPISETYTFEVRSAPDESTGVWEDFPISSSWPAVNDANTIRLRLKTENEADIVVVFTKLGHEYRGLMGAMIGFGFRHEGAGNPLLKSVTETFFQVNYRDNLDDAKKRFEQWLEAGLIKALEMWRAGL